MACGWSWPIAGTASLATNDGPTGGDFSPAAAYVGMWESRLEGLPVIGLANGVRLVVADRPLARLAGLAVLRELPRRTGLVIPDCRSVQTVGMRFKLDLI